MGHNSAHPAPRRRAKYHYVRTEAGAVVIDLAFIDYFEPVPPEDFEGYQDVQPIDPGFWERREFWRLWGYLAAVAVEGHATASGWSGPCALTIKMMPKTVWASGRNPAPRPIPYLAILPVGASRINDDGGLGFGRGAGSEQASQ